MAVSDRTIVIVGANIFGESILKALKDKWKIICIDIDENLINSLKEKYQNENIEFVIGDASSLLTWKKIKKNDETFFENIKYLIITVRDPDVSLETCRVVKEVLNIKAQIFVLLFYEEREADFEKYEVEILKPTDLITKILLTKIEKNYSIAINVGSGQGEIIEISILARSHLVDRKLKYLKATRWRIAAIYRDGKLIIPTGDEKIKVGDRVIIVGDPKVLQNLVELFTKGVPQFPQQFGSNIALPYSSSFEKSLEEAIYIKQNTQAHKVYIYPLEEKINLEKIKSLTENFEVKERINKPEEIFTKTKKENIGLYVYPIPKSIFPFASCKLKKVFELANKPFLISSGNFPYKNLIISLNCPDPAFVLSIGIELSRLMKIDYEVIYVTLPKELRGIHEEEALKEREEIIKDYEQIYKKKIKYTLLEGNPVRETVRYICETKGKGKNLFIIAYDKEQKISLFEPHVPFLIVKKLKCSSLVIPLGAEEFYG
ncbi:MAG: hypothetical protein GXO21_03410 [Aquificae bacterium]|nr:hypothetical protein [Aquificota bacterium]